MSKAASLSQDLFNQKSKHILEDLARLSQIMKGSSFEEFVTSEEKMTRAERYLERIVNRAIDVNQHLIRAGGAATPDDYQQSFLRLAELKILTPELAVQIAPSAGARNILVHEYDNLDAVKFYSSLQDALRLFPRYLEAIKTFLNA